MMTTIKLINISSQIVSIFVCVMRASKIYSLSKIPIFYKVLTIVLML